MIGAVLVHGAKAPYVIRREQLWLMKRERGARRRLDRPGRLLRDVAADDALRPDLRGRRRHALLRGEHARRGADHLDLRADQRHAAVRAARRRRGRRRRRAREPGAGQGRQRRGRQGHLRAAWRRGHRASAYTAARSTSCEAAGAARPQRRRRLAPAAAAISRRMPTTSQLVRKGRKPEGRSSPPRA